MKFTKDHKWLLASHLQKSIRRGWEDEAMWATSILHDVDRAYLAYRLSVIAVEDVGAGDIDLISSLIDEETPWGAKRFGSKKSDETKESFIEVSKIFASSIKDRTPCEWMSCSYWLEEFEKDISQSWDSLDVNDALDASFDNTKKWWWRGLMAWRVAGTDRFPSNNLPSIEGDWDLFIESSDTKLHTLLKGFGSRQREAHPVFIPLAYNTRKNTNAKILKLNCGPISKSGHWINPALDKHTSEGKRAILDFINNLPSKSKKELQQVSNYDRDSMINIIGSLMFWMEGGKLNKFWHYPLQDEMGMDIKKNWLRQNNISGRWLFDNFGNIDAWNESRFRVIQKINTYEQFKNKSAKI